MPGRRVVPVTRRDLEGPVLKDLSEATGPRVAAADARSAALVLAGWARTAAELETWLLMTGLISEAWSAPGGAR